MAEEIREMKPKNVMSVELAIKRELAYRKRVAKLWELYDGSMDGLKPLEVPSLNPKPCPSPSEKASELNSRPIQTPSSNPSHPLYFPTTNLSPPQKSSLHYSSRLKRKEPSNGKEHQDWIFSGNGSSQHETEKRLFCKICQVHCSADFNMKQHLQGQKHKVKLLLAKQGRGMEENKRWECEVCEILCTSEDLLKMHLQGKKHLFSLRCLEVEKRDKNADAASRKL